MLALRLGVASQPALAETGIVVPGAAAVGETVDKLRAIKVQSTDTEIPPAARPLIATLKRQLRELITQSLDEAPDASSADITNKVIFRLSDAGVTLQPGNDRNSGAQGDEPHDYTYGGIQRIAIEAPTGHPNLLVVTTTLWVMCGEDTSLHLFRRTKDTWQLILTDEAPEYRDISGAHSLFSYALSAPDKKGRFFIVTANVTPWCTSNWQRLRWAVNRPGRTPESAQRLLETSATIYVGTERPVYTLAVEADRLRISFHGDWYWDPDQGAAEQFADYSVLSNSTRLVRRGKKESAGANGSSPPTSKTPD